jgi:transitional endoplasmic reticulum ATPase
MSDITTTALPAEFDIADIMASVIAKTQEADFGAKVITGDEVEFHDGVKIGLPKGMTYGKAKKVLTRLEEEAETLTHFSRDFKFRPDDGAYAALQCIKNRWGMALGKVQYSFFGVTPAQKRTINIGVGQTMQVPWGLLEVPIFEGLELYLDQFRDRDYGVIFRIHGQGPRKYQDEIEGFFDDVQEYLETKSIYRGNAIIGSDDPDFLDLSTFDPSKIIFSDDVTANLAGLILGPIRNTDTMRREGIPLKRAVLLEGPYGTGKTSIGQLVAQVATQNGWTFISAKPGRDKVEDVLRTARLYQPAVVFVEDIDGEANNGEADAVTKLLEAFDGITSKGGELQVIMTTNHLDRIHKGMLRPGRLDAVLHVGALDRNGIERLVRAVVDPTKLDAATDFDAVAVAMEGFLPAFVKESLTRAVMFAIDRQGGQRTYTIGTEDLVNSAHSLRPQLEALEGAGEGERRPALEQAFTNVVKGAVKSLSTADEHGEGYSKVKEIDPETGDEVE